LTCIIGAGKVEDAEEERQIDGEKLDLFIPWHQC